MRHITLACLVLAFAWAAPLSAQQCYGCIFYPSSYEHEVVFDYTSGKSVTSPGGTHAAIPGQCSSTWGHHDCDPEPVLVPRILELLDDPHEPNFEIAAILRMEEAVRLHTARHAIQILGCEGQTVVAHLPLDPARSQALDFALTTTALVEEYQ